LTERRRFQLLAPHPAAEERATLDYSEHLFYDGDDESGFCRVQCGPAGRCGDGEEVGVLCLIILAVVSIVAVYTLYREG
jgi:hypothetical protein